MQSLFKSVISWVEGDASNRQGNHRGEVEGGQPSRQQQTTSQPIPFGFVDGQEFTSLPTVDGQTDNEDLSLGSTLASLQQNLSNLTSAENVQKFQQKLNEIRQNARVAELTNKISAVPVVLREAAKELGEEVSRELDQRRLQVGALNVNPDAPELRDHPFRFLPWEVAGSRYPQLVGPELYTEDQIERAIQAAVCEVSQQIDPNRPDLKDACPAGFIMDGLQQRCAVEVLKIDKHLESLRYQLVPRRLQEQEFWGVYFQILGSFLSTFPKAFHHHLDSIKEDDIQQAIRKSNRDKNIQQLIEEESNSSDLGTAPLGGFTPELPEFLKPTSLNLTQLLHTGASALGISKDVKVTEMASVGMDSSKATVLPPPPLPMGALDETVVLNPSIEKSRQIIEKPLVSDSERLPLNATTNGPSPPGVVNQSAPVIQKLESWVATGPEFMNDEDDELDEFEKQLLG
eukprot:Protomagalhaensia_wolfi_Nauph_80__4208@NODE_428_length_2539_cov_38_702000_g321_i0_p1_GENE_NODE_428_length_2539_cov_38_702000_g321_i0NODE_428_length_2539_cov_38_702000_g321_i0_p1_ORF_typecomplete_len458_score124_99BSD/PF03909_17/2_3e07BSD/PF03909_17/3_5e02Phage_HK97_TLTM/PF06120_11/0_0062KaiB/PF07689_12/0_16KaiB/PF07689_12/1_1e04ING/PF12998_7/2_5e02ING/PF12998_7/4_7GlutR_dimer/PF00745_20/15GlutR_dimer/PF00745_20/47_NODE_428_length_2539_cov_38_702000_g321_i011332506